MASEHNLASKAFSFLKFAPIAKYGLFKGSAFNLQLPFGVSADKKNYKILKCLKWAHWKLMWAQRVYFRVLG